MNLNAYTSQIEYIQSIREKLANYKEKAHTLYQKFSQPSGTIKKTVGQAYWHVMMKILRTVIYMAMAIPMRKGMKMSTFV